jgi:hypothetical protein
VTPARDRWWQRPSAWLGGIEIAAGLSLGLGGCVKSLATDASLAGIGAVVALAAGLVVLVLPGALLLLGRHPLRWVGQVLPAAILLWLLLG